MKISTMKAVLVGKKSATLQENGNFQEEEWKFAVQKNVSMFRVEKKFWVLSLGLLTRVWTWLINKSVDSINCR
jgi:hypothetical protein